MKDTREISREAVGTGEEHERAWTEYLITTVSYDKGGPNYFSGGSTKRGYYLVVRLEKKHADGGTSFDLFTGGRKKLMQEAARFSPKVLDALVPDPALVAEMRGHMLAERAAKAVRA